jgi:hypothetical protein
MYKQFFFETRKNTVIVKMRNYSKDFFHWFFQHPYSIKITEYELIDETLIINNHNLYFIEKLMNDVFLAYIGYDK